MDDYDFNFKSNASLPVECHAGAGWGIEVQISQKWALRMLNGSWLPNKHVYLAINMKIIQEFRGLSSTICFGYPPCSS